MNSKVLITVVVIIIIATGAWFIFGSNKQAQPINSMTQTNTSQTPVTGTNITIQNFKYSPETITIKSGSSITWTNQDRVGHSATADDNSFDTGVLDQGQSKTITFSKPGTYAYHCNVHPMMKATVIVQ